MDSVTKDEASTLPEILYSKEGFSPLIRVLRGKRMHTLQSLMQEFAAAFQFFEGFGDNWNALEECLFYLDDTLPADSYLVVITRPHEVLADGNARQLDTFLDVLENVGDWWSKPIVDNPPFNRGPVPFHTVLQVRGDELGMVVPRFERLPFLDRQA